ncbi:MAG: hypothetical protein ABJC61_10550 [Acidobacteriota bacterium]
MLTPKIQSAMCGMILLASIAFLSACAENHHRVSSRPLTAADCDYARNHVIWVFDDGSVTEECAAIKWKTHQIVWIAASADAQALAIDLVVRKNQKEPFEKMHCGAPDPNGDRVCRLDCKKERCRSGSFNRGYSPDPRSDYFSYVPGVTLLTGTNKGADPGIRIDP